MSKKFSILPLVLASGERLPALVEMQTWIPVLVGTQWSTRYRRYRVQSSTLTQDLRAIARLYDWSWNIASVDLDRLLLSGQTLSTAQVRSLAEHLRHGKTVEASGTCAVSSPEAAMATSVHFNNAYDRQLSVIEAFLIWALDRENRGGGSALSLEQIALLQVQLQRVFQTLRGGFVPSKRIEPLSKSEVERIRQVIAPLPDFPQRWEFPTIGFTRSAQLRNWLMFETALGLGLRRGELLKLRVESLVNGGKDGIRVLRYPDDPHDSRVREPAVKSAERLLPLSPLLLEAIPAYLSLRPPLGRVTGKTPYLFTTRDGKPVSLDAADSIAATISRRSGIAFSWHSLRHTWAEHLADQLLQREDGIEILMYLGGWTSPKSPEHYIEHARHRQAGEWLKTYQRSEEDETSW